MKRSVKRRRSAPFSPACAEGDLEIFNYGISIHFFFQEDKNQNLKESTVHLSLKRGDICCHEEGLLDLLDEKRLQYVDSVVLGLDAFWIRFNDTIIDL